MATWKGLEPSTSSVTGWHSNQLNYQAANVCEALNGGNNRARTCDPLLVRQVLSQLSYAPINYSLVVNILPFKSTLLVPTKRSSENTTCFGCLLFPTELCSHIIKILVTPPGFEPGLPP